MLQSLFRKSFRAQLIVPTTIALLAMISSAIIFTLIMQNRSSTSLNKFISLIHQTQELVQY